MTASELLAHLRERGASIEVADGCLRVRLPKGLNTPDVREALAARKAEILALLAPVTTRQPGRDENGFPLDRLKYIDGLEPLPELDRRTLEFMRLAREADRLKTAAAGAKPRVS